MTLKPNNWVESERETFADTVATAIVDRMSDQEKDRVVWDLLFEELMSKEWHDLWAEAEEYAPHLVEPLLSDESRKSQREAF
jgi:hypothetical protein